MKAFDNWFILLEMLFLLSKFSSNCAKHVFRVALSFNVFFFLNNLRIFIRCCVIGCSIIRYIISASVVFQNYTLCKSSWCLLNKNMSTNPLSLLRGSYNYVNKTSRQAEIFVHAFMILFIKLTFITFFIPVLFLHVVV